MYQHIFDTHAHYLHGAFDIDRDALLSSLPEQGVCCVMLAGCSIADSRECIALAERHAHLYTAVGIHPEELHTIQEGWQSALTAMAAHPKVKAIGECGLDYHTKGYDKALQREVLVHQMTIARELGLPVILHIRDAMGDALELLRRYRPKGVIHCFSGSAETAEELVRLGLYLGFGGVLTYGNARRVVEAVKAVPEDRMLFETDCPYLTPQPHRGERNDSRNIRYVAELAAALRGTDAQTLINACCENGRRLFGIG